MSSSPSVGSAVLARHVKSLVLMPDIVREKTTAIYQRLLCESPRVRQGNFEVVGSDDLRRLFGHYDAEFFDGLLQQEVDAQAAGRLSFRLSRRMTSTGGTTARFRRRLPAAGGFMHDTRYEITVSTTLLYQTFSDLERTVKVSGVECHDRLEALQRIFEHELLHLLEMLVWGHSKCSAPRFKQLARNVFAHTDVKHELVLQRERAARHYEVRQGDRVAFEYERVQHVGVVNRITRRATVLVEDRRGQPYSDGRRYLKFYIPLALLRKAD